MSLLPPINLVDPQSSSSNRHYSNNYNRSSCLSYNSNNNHNSSNSKYPCNNNSITIHNVRCNNPLHRPVTTITHNTSKGLPRSCNTSVNNISITSKLSNNNTNTNSSSNLTNTRHNRGTLSVVPHP